MNIDIMLSAVPTILTGLKLTVIITLFSFILGQVLALPLALAATSRWKVLAWPAHTYIFLVRGSPMLVQLFLIYYGLGTIDAVRQSFLWAVLKEPVDCAIIAVGLNSAAYMGALLTGALRNMPNGLSEAARSLGMNRFQTLTRITLPVMYRQIIPVMGNEMTIVLKGSSLASTITVMEMTGIARKTVSQTFAPFEVFAVAGAVYLLVGLVAAWGFRLLENRLAVPGMGSAKP